MANIGHKLKIKYGLPSEPTEAQISNWKNEVARLRRLGDNAEAAGSKAAAALFVGFQTHKYASVADDIESLLDAAKDR